MVSSIFSETDILNAHIEKIKNTQIYKYLGISFTAYVKEIRKSKHLLHAFIHCSLRNKNSYLANYERLEFLGDSLIYFIISDFLSKDFPDFTPYHLSVVRQKFISTKTLVERSCHIKLNELLISNPTIAFTSDSRVYADIFESFVGALYLSFGIDVVRHFLEQTLYVTDFISNLVPHKDFKTILQEIFQASETKLLYECFRESSQDIKVQISHCGLVFGVGSGKNRKSAEQTAAFDALQKLWDPEFDVSRFLLPQKQNNLSLDYKNSKTESGAKFCSSLQLDLNLHNTVWSFASKPK